jgi:hypothetical protein
MLVSSAASLGAFEQPATKIIVAIGIASASKVRRM